MIAEAADVEAEAHHEDVVHPEEEEDRVVPEEEQRPLLYVVHSLCCPHFQLPNIS